MNIVLIVLWYVSWFVIGFFVGYFIRRSIKKRILKRQMIEREFYNYRPIVRKEEHERTTQEGIDEMGNVLREHNSLIFDF